MLLPRVLLASLAIAALLPLAAAGFSPAPTVRHAVLVGIDRYTGDGSAAGERGWRDLAGAVNDVRAMRTVLERRHGFDAGNIHTLLDEEATRTAVLATLEDTLTRARAHEVVLFYYSGHGSQVANSRSDESDRLDESIVPADANAGAPDIRDKELRALFGPAADRGVELVVVLDSCHSGSATRGPSSVRTRAIGPDMRDVADGRDYGPPPAASGALVLAAARPHELAREIELDTGEMAGAFSSIFVDVLAATPPGTPAQEVFARVRSRMRSLPRIRQEPVLEATPQRRRQPIFGGPPASSVAAAFVTRLDDAAQDITIQGGFAQGIEVGTLLADEERNVRIEVLAVDGPGSSRGRIVAGDAAAVRPGTSLVVVAAPPPPPTAVRYRLPAPVADELLDELARQARRWNTSGAGRPLPDPTTARRTVYWNGDSWRLEGDVDAGERDLGASLEDLEPATGRGGGTFVSLPPSTALATALERALATTPARASGASDDADYMLVGEAGIRGVRFAWVAPGGGGSAWDSPLPVRTDWVTVAAHRGEERVAEELAAQLARLNRLLGWLTIDPPGIPRRPFPYELELVDRHESRTVEDGRLVGGRLYDVHLVADPEVLDGLTPRRHVYVFAIDRFGDSVLLYPDPARPAELLPPPGDPLARLRLVSVRVGPPFGIDTYVLLATREPLVDPLVLQFTGVRSRGEAPPSAPLDLLFATVGVDVRGGSSRPVPTSWSIRRTSFTSHPPESPASQTQHQE